MRVLERSLLFRCLTITVLFLFLVGNDCRWPWNDNSSSSSSNKVRTSSFLFVQAAFDSTGGGRSRPSSANGGARGPIVVDRRSLAGLWRLTPQFSPMKEFTVYPKKSSQTNQDADNQLLLMLKADGSFQSFSSSTEDLSLDDDDDQETDVFRAWTSFQQSKEKARKRKEEGKDVSGIKKGVWDYRDGKLLLAADRLDDASSTSATKTTTTTKSPSTTTTTTQVDTLLVGRVVASFETSLQVPGQEGTNTEDDNNSTSTLDATATANTNKVAALSTRLSVPSGSIKVGRFIYPRNHPSFFEQPMFKSSKRGGFALQKVFSSLEDKPTATDDEDDLIERFRRSDFYNKTFLLTSHPIGYRQKTKKEEPWTPNRHKKLKQESNNNNIPMIRVLKVIFHSNNTFSTLAGFGDSTVLRGKFDVIGKKRDQFWMQIWRFGFGRSVSGSVFSEGRMLTQDDAKMYWGSIAYEHDYDEKKTSLDEGTSTNKPDQDLTTNMEQSRDGDGEHLPQRLEVRGSVMLGSGLEPMPVGRFILREQRDEDEDEYNLEEEEDEGEEEEDDNLLGDRDKSNGIVNTDERLEDDGVDWSNSNPDSFQ